MKKILVVDDHEPLRKAVKLLIESKGKKLGYKVFEAANGREALEIITKKSPELAIVDLMMPEVDGYTLCNEIKVINSEISVIILTAKTDRATAKEVKLHYQPDKFLTKPVDNRVLFETVTEILEKQDVK
ncbi:response regulator [Candidatus Beckwithbacteria bacterium]|nr:response regulator [Candidatus Beckwithbacteria bacterium]